MTTKKLFWLLMALPFVLIGSWQAKNMWQTQRVRTVMIKKLKANGYPQGKLTHISKVTRQQDFLFDAPTYTMTFRQSHDQALYIVSESQTARGHWTVTLNRQLGGVDVWQTSKTLN